MPALRRIGVDTGGTFTDCVLVDYDRNQVRVAKVPSVPSQPQEAILTGVARLDDGGAPVESVVHGTTIATNAVIVNDLARCGMITTRGFRDALEIGTQTRGKLYDLRQSRPPLMVPRQLRVEVAGRCDAEGVEIEPIDRDEIAAATAQLLAAGVESIAVACAFAYVAPDQEIEIQRIVREHAPGIYVCRSSEVTQEPREYPRFATAAVNAALAPKLDPYISSLRDRLAAPPLAARLYVMQSNGGIGTAARSMGEHAHQLLLSGPAAGVVGGAREAAAAGFRSCITFDVGGTSADIGVVLDERPRTTVEMTLPNGVPCKVAHIEVDAIGAGGGSIAGVDVGGALTVGPRSAGAAPGPACYGWGGTEPTVTDAQLLLGRLSAAGLIDGELPLDVDLAREALARIGAPLGVDADAAALGVIAVLEENTAGAIRSAAARHGDDLRDFALVAGGGAGPLLAAPLMLALGMPATIIPPYPGLLSAFGLLGAHLRHDHVAPLPGAEGTLTDEQVAACFAAIERHAAEQLSADDVAAEDQSLERGIDVRYVGQEHALTVPMEQDERFADVVARFHVQHERTFGHAAPELPVESVVARVIAYGLRPMPELPRETAAAEGTAYATRPVRFRDRDEPYATAIYRRSELARGQRVDGPAIIEQLDTTTVVPPGARAEVHESAALVITPTEDVR